MIGEPNLALASTPWRGTSRTLRRSMEHPWLVRVVEVYWRGTGTTRSHSPPSSSWSQGRGPPYLEAVCRVRPGSDRSPAAIRGSRRGRRTWPALARRAADAWL